MSHRNTEKDRGAKRKDQDERARTERKEDEVTTDSKASFPASDPPSFNPGTTGAHDGNKEKKR
jgi:hypothetical protein